MPSANQRSEKKRESEKKRQAKIAANPHLLQAEKEKRHQKYLNRLAKGQRKLVNDLSQREKRLQLSRWRKSSKKYRADKKKNEKFEAQLRDNSPPSSPESELSEDRPDVERDGISSPRPSPRRSSRKTSSCEDGRKLCGRKKVRREKTKTYRKLQSALKSLKAAEKKTSKYKQRYYRLLSSDSRAKTILTPRSKVRHLLKDHRLVSHAVKKKLVYGEVLHLQMETSYNHLKTDRDKKDFRRMFNGSTILKAYRCRSTAKHFLKYRTLTSDQRSKGLLYEGKRNKDNDIIKQKIQRFLESDESSRMCPGKKDTVTRKKVKKQKRLLNDSLLNLHKKFILKYPLLPFKNVSYSRFCALRPFWILHPSVNNRDTCACTIHANMCLLMGKLKVLKVISYKTTNELIKDLCCEGESAIECMLRKCQTCCNKLIIYNEFNALDSVNYSRWILKKETRIIRGKESDVKFTAKVNIESTIGDIIQIFEDTFPKFMVHVANIKNQYCAMDLLKKHLRESEAIVHIDFSENYGCKYAEEVQSVHFGAARQQVTLHTGVFYVKPTLDEKLRPVSFCTVSDSMRHDPAAIWAHLSPILKHIHVTYPGINTIHFLSDSPSTQYRNKNNFFLITRLLKTYFPSIAKSTWNFSESGHGKGAPDGIGGTLKRTADQIVAHGVDITSFNELVGVLRENTKKIIIETVTEAAIVEVDFVLQGHLVQPFKGTMKVHQATWNADNRDFLSMRSLSCFEVGCEPGSVCCHYGIGKGGLWRIVPRPTEETDDFSSEDDAPLRNLLPGVMEVKVGDWVLVTYNQQLYPGTVVEGPDNDNNWIIEAMEPIGKNRFKWPLKKDVHAYMAQDIVKHILPPIPCGTRASQFYFESTF